TTRYELEKKGGFPSRRNLGGRSVGWLLSEVMDWVQSRDRVNSGKAA
ncbi:AlpA family phage regulatory protein, partial [Escherichia coli]